MYSLFIWMIRIIHYQFKVPSFYLTRYVNDEQMDLSSHETTVNDISFLTKLTMHFTSTCISGITMSFNDGNRVLIGYPNYGTNMTHLDLSGTKKLYSFKSVCNLFCDSFIICSIDTITLLIECVTSGSTNKYPLDQYNSVSLDSMGIYSIFATTINYGSDKCISNLGMVCFPLWPTTSLNYMNLFRLSIEKPKLNFTQNASNLTSLIVNYDTFCVTGLGFVYGNGEYVSVGFNGTSFVSLDLSGTRALFSVETRCKAQDTLCYFMRLCSFDTANKPMEENVCVDAGNFNRDLFGLKHFASLSPIEQLISYDIPVKILSAIRIQSFYGDFNQYNGHNCIQNFGINYFLGIEI
jgi:hypothetical protein